MFEALTHNALPGPLLAAVTDADAPQLAFLALAALAAVAVFVDKVSAIWDRFREKPAASAVYATRTELSEVHRRVDGVLTKFTESMDKITTEVTESLQELSTKVDGELKEMRKENGEINKSLASIHRSLGRLEGHNDQGGHHQ